MISTLGENLKRLRTARSLTQEEVAGQLGISYQSVSKWERGEGYPDITMLPALAHYFGVSTDLLLGMQDRAAQYMEKSTCAGRRTAKTVCTAKTRCSCVRH